MTEAVVCACVCVCARVYHVLAFINVEQMNGRGGKPQRKHEKATKE